MSNNPNEVHNFEELMRKYLKNNEPMMRKFDYQSPLKEISPIEPLLFQNDNNNPVNIQNFESRYNKDINNNIQNNINIRNNLVDNNNINNNLNDNKFITPSKPNTKNISNINSFINSSIEREKEAKEEKKKKQLEYQRMLDEQIKEKKLRQKLEKEKRMKEDLLFEEKLKLENEKYQQEINKAKNKIKNNNNIFSGEEKNINPISSKNFILNNNNNIINNLNQEKDIEENIAQNRIINNGVRRVKSQPYLEEINNNNIFEINKNQKYKIQPPYINVEGAESQENFIPNSDQNLHQQQQIPIEHLVSTSSQIPTQFLNQNQNHPQYKTQNNYYPANRNFQNQSQNIFQNVNYQQQSQPPQADLSPYMTQRQYYDYRQKMHKMPSDLSSNTNVSITPSNFPTSYQIPFNNNLMNSSPNPVNFNNNSQNINELFNMNINNQNYFGKIMEIFFHEQEKILENYKETIEKLKNERDEAIFKNKASEEKILALQKMQKDQEILEKNLGYFPFKNSYQQNMERTLDSIIQKNEDYNNNKLINNNKKEEKSLNNINSNSNSNVSDSKLPSLITSTKFVKVNTNGDNKHLLETWKKEDNLENNNDDNNINIEDYKNKNKLNGMDTNAFMEKINLINNKLLEPPEDIPQNYLNDNISIISKTQKNEDKSFANELITNRDDKEEKNINNKNSFINNKDLEEINNNNNIRDSDLSTQKFIAELQSKDFILNNVHNPIIQNLDNNVSYSTQVKERLEEKNKKINQNKNKIDIISEKESKLSHNYDDEKKQKYQNYAFKQIKCSNSKEKKLNIDEDDNNENQNQNFNIKLLPGLKNIDNNLTVSTSKKNYSILVSRHTANNNNINNDHDNEKNPFENAASINDEEENININMNMNNNIKNNKINIEEKSQDGEEINDIPNLDSPRNDYKLSQYKDIQKNIGYRDDEDENENENEEDENININIKQNNINSKVENKNDDEIIDRLNFFEDDNISKIKLDKKESKNNKYNNINLDINESFPKVNTNNINKDENIINNNINNINELSRRSNNPQNDLNGDKIASLNNLYDQYMKKKKEKLNETNNSMINNNNNIENNSLLNESLNTFTQNLNKKWKDLTKKDINNIKSNREQHYNEDNYENNLSYLEDDKFEDEKIFDKVNQFTRVALNELKQSQLSVFSKDKTFKKYD